MIYRAVTSITFPPMWRDHDRNVSYLINASNIPAAWRKAMRVAKSEVSHGDGPKRAAITIHKVEEVGTVDA